MFLMAVAYVPAYSEDRAAFVKERANGLYGAMPFMLSNFLIGLPYLCMQDTIPDCCCCCCCCWPASLTDDKS